jgi:RimJ/RimL family protein N-acetyltransferase
MIETERLLLRQPSREDLDAVHLMRADPEVVRFVGGKALTREEAWQKLARSAGNWALLGYGFFAVIEKASGLLVGESGLMQAHRGLGERFDPFPEAGWIFSRAAQGKGYATEATLAAHGWFARSVGAVRTVCIIAPDNTASLRVAAKLGYTAFGSACYHDSTVTMLERRAG